jgi:hypothetical protein
MNRFTWNQTCEAPQRHELFDSLTQRAIGVVEEFDIGWKWTRATNYLLHGVHPAHGTAKTVTLAKVAVAHGLPDEMYR